jgi:Trypsin
MAHDKTARESAKKEPPSKSPTLLDNLEQISKISVPIMIPVVIAVIGFVGNDYFNARQSIIEQKKVDLEYVKIAKEVASNVKETDSRIVNWAYRTLFQLSPVKVPQNDVDDLADKRVPLSPSAIPPPLVGGQEVADSNWPWLVGIYRKWDLDALQFICNGTLLSPTAVLTAAHCVNVGKPGDYEVAGPIESSTLNSADQSRPLNTVLKITLHPKFTMPSGSGISEHDIAILSLLREQRPPFARISSQRSTDPHIGALALIAAQNYLKTPKASQQALQAAVPIANAEKCLLKIFDTQICTGFQEGGVSGCVGSSGAPLVGFDKSGQKYQIGFIIAGRSKCTLGDMGGDWNVSTRVSSYADWIKQTVPNVLGVAPTDLE